MAEATFRKDGDIVAAYLTIAVVAGQIVQLPCGKAGVARDSYAANARGEYKISGWHEVAKVITQTMLQSNKVYWDTSASTCNLLHGGSTDFYLGAVVADAAYTATTVMVDLNEVPVYNLSLDQGYHAIPIQTAGFPAINGFGNGVNFYFSTTAEAQKLDALSIRNVATGTPGVLQALVCCNLNGDDAAFDFGIGLADSSHATSTDTITSSLLLHTDGNSLNLNIESDNAAAEVGSTDTTIDMVVGTPFLVTWDLRDWAAIKCYINGLRVGDGTTGSAVTLTLAGVAGPLKLLAHMVKSSNDSPGNFTVMDFGFTSFDAAA